MNKIAVIKTGGKQYIVSPKSKLKVEKLKAKKNGQISFDTLLVSDGKDVKLGTPTLQEKVEAKVLDQGRAKKIRVVHYKAKTRQHSVQGHRQPFSQVEITKI